MDEIEEWLNKFIEEFRRTLDKKQYKEYKEFIPAFTSDNPYLLLELWEELYDGNLGGYELRIYPNEYCDKIQSGYHLEYVSTIGVDDPKEQMLIKSQNHNIWQGTLFKSIGYDEEENIESNISYPMYTIKLPLEFYNKDISEFVSKEIDRVVLQKLKESKYDTIIQKSLNRLSVISDTELDDIRNFLDDDWTQLKDSQKVPILNKIFYYLGFETIPIELLLQHKKYVEFNNKSHPELIAYDINSNYILMIEELSKLEAINLYKKDPINAILKKFNSFFPKENRIINYTFIINEEPTIDLDHYDVKERIILKEDFINELKKIFKPDINDKNLFDFLFGVELERCINFVRDKT